MTYVSPANFSVIRYLQVLKLCPFIYRSIHLHMNLHPYRCSYMSTYSPKSLNFMNTCLSVSIAHFVQVEQHCAPKAWAALTLHSHNISKYLYPSPSEGKVVICTERCTWQHSLFPVGPTSSWPPSLASALQWELCDACPWNVHFSMELDGGCSLVAGIVFEVWRVIGSFSLQQMQGPI